jgi:hypothetical protein
MYPVHCTLNNNRRLGENSPVLEFLLISFVTGVVAIGIYEWSNSGVVTMRSIDSSKS